MKRSRLTGFQALTLTLLGLLDTAKRELTADEYALLLDIVATRIARDVVPAALGERKAA